MPILSTWKSCLGDRPFYREMTRLILPLVIQGTITNAVNLLDNLMIGQTGTLQMSAVAIVKIESSVRLHLPSIKGNSFVLMLLQSNSNREPTMSPIIAPIISALPRNCL